MSNIEELNYAIISELRNQLEAERVIADKYHQKYNKAIWWLKEIVNNHRFTPISTAEMALKKLEELDE